MAVKYVYLVDTGSGVEVWNQLSKLCKSKDWSYEYVRRRGSENGYPVDYKGFKIDKKPLL